ncbi:phage terminase small subunit P27 family [Nitrosomonas marina]|uniref:Phage terminase, small subunit, putative, P27 family n=1 Tax=Nitrosomonas marina TaxID=917 RepID=A0A1H8GIW4_9PROT|nr:phage terminase small subunit P27 family [Nitrosomonas marina]SEN43684.1 phage terminase, small subunit, putative, P27 family [Nitrosomonas marina]
MGNVLEYRRNNQGKQQQRETILDDAAPEVAIPDCPPHLKDEALSEYKRICEELKKLGLISRIDRAAISAYCKAWSEVVYCEIKIDEENANDPRGQAGFIAYTPNGYQQMSVWVQVRNRASERMMSFLKEFGMTPRSRRKSSQFDNTPSLPFGDGWENL